MPKRQLQYDRIQFLYSAAISKCIYAVFYCVAVCKHICMCVMHFWRGLCHNCVTCPCFSQISSATEIYPLIIAKFGVSVVVTVLI